MPKIFHCNFKRQVHLFIVAFAIAILFAAGCRKQETEYVTTPSEASVADQALRHSNLGTKQHFAIKVDGDIREYYVNIPSGYNGSTPLPVVFMLHGSGGNGLKFYNISGWVEEGDSLNIITVYPSSWKYDCVFDDGIDKHNAEKWNTYDLVLCDNNKKRDDVKFLSAVIDDVKNKFNTDTNRVYMVGFSNGGEMASRCAIELSNKLAAVVSCAGALPTDTNLTPVRNLPVLLQMGAADEKLMANAGTASHFPMDIPLVLSTYPIVQSVINSYINSFGLVTTPAFSGNPNRYLMATYQGLSGRPENVFRFTEVKGLSHQYPNGHNHWLHGASVHWEWMKNFSLH